MSAGWKASTPQSADVKLNGDENRDNEKLGGRKCPKSRVLCVLLMVSVLLAVVIVCTLLTQLWLSYARSAVETQQTPFAYHRSENGSALQGSRNHSATTSSQGHNQRSSYSTSTSGNSLKFPLNCTQPLCLFLSDRLTFDAARSLCGTKSLVSVSPDFRRLMKHKGSNPNDDTEDSEDEIEGSGTGAGARPRQRNQRRNRRPAPTHIVWTSGRSSNGVNWRNIDTGEIIAHSRPERNRNCLARVISVDSSGKVEEVKELRAEVCSKRHAVACEFPERS